MLKIKMPTFTAINYLFQGLCVSFLFLLSGCEMIEYHPYDLDIDGEKNINEKNITKIEKITKDKEEFSFVVISDTQRWYDETNDAVDQINKMKDVDFVVHTGDISDFGLKMEFEEQRDIMNRLKVPYIVVLGNHDCLGTGPQLFKTIFGEENFAFTAGNVRFICLNTNALEFDYTDAVPDFLFLEKELKQMDPKIKKTVVAMHSGPFSEQFNKNVVNIFHEYIKTFPNLQFCVYGHQHHTTVDDFFNDGILYYQCPCAEARRVLHFTIRKEDYLYETIDY